ncbi:MAG: Hint domain-containing protein [Xanthobacteraceae bacterium]
MVEKQRAPKTAKVETTRRDMIARNMKVIGGLAATGVVATLLKPARARANVVGGQCFLRGTKIQAVQGERNVEDLVIGDLLPTVFGGARPVQWIARYRRTKADRSKPWVKQAQPIRIMRSALAPNVPHADLYVTDGHSLLVDGVLVTAASLINGTTIARYAADEHEELEFFQVKLETHDVIYAEGAPCETLLKVSETASNFADYFRRYGADESRDVHCAPVFGNGYRSELKLKVRGMMSPWLGPQKIDVIRERLEARAIAAVDGLR